MATFRRNTKGEERYSTGLTAAALQDHLSRQLSLSSSPLPQNSTSQRRRRRKKRERREEECVLDPVPPPLSLAEKLGLTPGPPPQLTSVQWEQVKTTSRERQDSTTPCPICHDDFGTRQQVLLSCSHVFHRQCLKSMERFSGKKSCPLCRHDNYQMRLIQDGRYHHRIKCAIRIQSWWRGVKTRRWYHEVRKTIPPNNPSLRHQYFHHKLSSITSQLVRSCDQQCSVTDSVLAAADSALEEARTAMRILEKHHQSVTVQTDWMRIKMKARETVSTTECPICIFPLLLPDTNTHHSSHRPISVLSCGHVIHETCITSLEHYCSAEGDLFLCPLCRSPYVRQPLNL